MYPPSGKSRAFGESIIVTLIGIYAVYDALSPRELPGQRLLYATIFMLVLASPVLFLRRVRLSKGETLGIFAALLLTVIWAIPLPTQPVLYPTYVVGDLASLLLPVVLYFCGVQFPGLFGVRSIVLLGALLTIAALVAVLFPDATGRYEPPAIPLIALVWSLLFVAKTVTARVGVGVCLIALTIIAFESSVRTNAALCVIGGIPLLFLVPRIFRRLAVSVIGLLIILPFLGTSDVVDRATSYLLESRFKSLMTGRTDESLSSRYLEAHDAILTAKDEWNSMNYVLGYGHGATYRPTLSFIERNVTSEGRVHNIHIGPVMIWFRYGALGVVLLVAGLASLAVILWRTATDWRKAEVDFTQLVMLVSAVLYAGDFLLRNSMTDPVFSYVVAGICGTTARLQTSLVARSVGVDERVRWRRAV